ncbi:hypothetical protein HRK28_04630 [Rathayibacter sp. VKM Ac-2835]|uniref:hypothetical protein n=1 Tax=Rathayibacter sp. VKM Ac-2835 TaxID=2739043 RepID=UPI0015642F15|nr:hypothetical protein [Rathayibacter sp. VKM Ac-2835]NRG40200.1 hypothetical protein [Rathayibacter sp. VKM Ac-2835]
MSFPKVHHPNFHFHMPVHLATLLAFWRRAIRRHEIRSSRPVRSRAVVTAHWRTTMGTSPGALVARPEETARALLLLRRRAGLTIRQAARIANVAPLSIAFAEYGVLNRVTIVMLFRLSRAYTEAIVEATR